MKEIGFTAIITGSVAPSGNDPDGEHTAITPEELKANLHVAMQSILGDGRVTGESPATVESVTIKIAVG